MSDAAAEVLLGALGEIEVGASPIVIGEETGRLAVAIARSGSKVTTWLRRACASGPAASWPPAGPFSSALIRLPKSKAALDFALHAAGSELPPAAAIVVFGANDEGIRSVPRRLESVADAVTTVVTRRHCRVLVGNRKAVIAGHRDRLSAWRSTGRIDLLGRNRLWVSYPGAFAKGGVDPATALLIASLPPLAVRARVLDFAAGTGVIAAAVLQRQPDASVDAIEIDTVSLAALAENVPRAESIAGSSLAAVAGRRYDLILSNPPIHDGVAEDHRVLQALVRDAPGHLAPGGELRIVVQRRVDAAALLESAFGDFERIAETSSFRVLSGRHR